jgi:hypothetical protein
MARIRTIKPEFWQNEELASISQHARLLAIALLNHADDQGCFLANAALVRAACFPFEEDSKNVPRSLQELSKIGYIEIRKCNGKDIGVVCKFLEHQRIDKPQKSKLIDVFRANSRENSDSKNVPGTFQEDSKKTPRLEGKGKEGKGNGKGMESLSGEASESPSPPVFNPSDCRFPVFPCVREPETWEASESDLNAWRQTYPGVDIDHHHRRAHAWVMANLTQRKTAVGMRKFLNTWFAKQQDRISPASVASQRTFAQLSIENSANAIKEFSGG